MKRNRRRRNSRGELASSNTGGMQQEGNDNMKIPETPGIDIIRSPPISQEQAGLDGSDDHDDHVTSCEQLTRHAHAQSEGENEEVADAQEGGTAARKPRRTKASLAKRKKKSPVPLQQTLENRRKFEATFRRGLLSAAENNTPLPQWMRRQGAGRLGDVFVRLRTELLAPGRDQAKIAQLLAGLAGPSQQGANRDEGADGPGPGAKDGGEAAEATVGFTGEEARLPARDHVGDEL